MDDDDPREWSPLHQEVAAFKKIKEQIDGPQERIPESLVRRTLAEQYGCKPEEVTLEQIHFEVSGLLPFYPAIRLIPSRPIPVDPPSPDAPLAHVVFSHSPTYQKLVFRGNEYDLTQHKYAPEIVRVLHESLKDGKAGLTTVQIRKLAKLPHNGKMYDWFRGTGLWKNLVVTAGRDTYRLDIPNP